MARKIPPVAVQLMNARVPSSALHRKLLVDFDLGSAVLERQHETWLRHSIENARKNASFHVWLFGYASRTGTPEANKALSLKRLNSVLAFLQKIEPKTLENIDAFESHGEQRAELAGVKDGTESFEDRAVEVHIFIGKPQLHEKPNLPEIPIPKIRPLHRPLPGGVRTKEWAVASPGGAFVSVGGGAGFNIFFIKNKKLSEVRGYFQPIIGIGAGLSIPGLKPVWNAIQSILTGVSAAPPDFTDVEPSVPVTWDEMESCLVRVSSGGGGVLATGYAWARITFTSSGVWQYNEFGNPVKVVVPGDGVLFQFDSLGKSWQLGVAGASVIGPLVRIPG